jgi:hypothetical protein
VWSDADGIGGIMAQQVAVFATLPALTSADFVLV